MSVNVEALKELAGKVEAGSAKPHEVFNAFDTLCQCMSLQHRGEDAKNAYKGSLDAAKSLMDSVLPLEKSNGGSGWSVELYIDYDADKVEGPDYRCVIHDGNYHCCCSRYEEATSSASLARAWLLCILRALIAQEESK